MINKITVTTAVNAPLEKAWELWNGEEHIPHWAFASDDWEAPWAKNDLRTGGTLTVRMQDKATAQGFDLAGTYTDVQEHALIEYTMGDRKVSVVFETVGGGTKITETFDAENENPEEMQRQGWQAMLNNFKKYAESV